MPAIRNDTLEEHVELLVEAGTSRNDPLKPSFDSTTHDLRGHLGLVCSLGLRQD